MNFYRISTLALLFFGPAITAAGTLAFGTESQDSGITPLRASLVLASAAAQKVKAAQAEKNWQMIQLQGFSMSLPPQMKEIPVLPVDSYVKEFEGGGMKLMLDYGWYSAPLDGYKDESDYKEESSVISGKNAKIITCLYAGKILIIGVHFPSLGKNMRLTVIVEAETAAQQEVAKTIFRSIIFKKIT